MAARATATPPLPPSVTRQQSSGSPLVDAAQAGAGQQGPAPQGSNPQQFIKAQLATVAQSLMKIAKVMQVESPELMPILQRMVGAGQMLEQEFDKASQQQGAGIPADPGASQQPTSSPDDDQGNSL